MAVRAVSCTCAGSDVGHVDRVGSVRGVPRGVVGVYTGVYMLVYYTDGYCALGPCTVSGLVIYKP